MYLILKPPVVSYVAVTLVSFKFNSNTLYYKLLNIANDIQ